MPEVNRNPVTKFDTNRILVIATRRIGDVLLTTPLLRSLRRGYPQARIDVLVHTSTAGILAGNPDVDDIITVPERPDPGQYRRLIVRTGRRYDLAISTQTGDRPITYAVLAARDRVAPVPQAGSRGAWKRHLLRSSIPFDDRDTHTVVQNLRLADLLGIARDYTVVPPGPVDDGVIEQAVPFGWRNQPFAVLHPAPMFHYKRWHPAGWQALVAHLHATGLRVVVTGGPGAEESNYIAETLGGQRDGVTNLAGQLDLAGLATLLGRARLYVGPDTAITHLAAAAGTPTVALYGPTNPVKWGPWPTGCTADPGPYRRTQPLQQVNNVILLQGLGECVPCHREGCDDRLDSHARCLDEMPASRVCAACDQIMAHWAR